MYSKLGSFIFVTLCILVAIGICAWVIACKFPQLPDSDFYKTFRASLEILYFLSGTVLAILAYSVFEQIKVGRENLTLTKKENETRSKHETGILTLYSCDNFSERIITMCAVIDREMKNAGIQKYSGSVAESFVFDDQCLAWTQELQKLDNTVTNINRSNRIKYEEQVVVFLNSLETFALRFTEKFCDEELAFKVHGQVYCDYVSMFYPLIAKYRRDDPRSYDPIVELFCIWRRRLRAERNR